MKHLLLLALVLCSSIASAKSHQWIMFDQDDAGWSYIDKATIKPVDTTPHIFEIDYKYVYRHGVPSINIKPKGYMQAVHQIDCQNKARAYVKSQRFTPQGKALDKDDLFSGLYFEPMSMQLPSNIKLIKMLCTK